MRGQHGIRSELNGTGHIATKPRPTSTGRTADSDEEDGRSSLGKIKRRRVDQLPWVKAGDPDEDEAQEAAPAVPTKGLPPPVKDTKKRPASYLDEVLAARSKKKKKKMGQAQQTDIVE